MKIVINDASTGLSYQKELEKDKVAMLTGKKIREKLDGGLIGLDGYSIQVMGGSNKDGLPMRGDIRGPRKAKALLRTGPGVRGLKKGQRVKKAVYGNTVSADIVQLNVKILVAGAKKLEEFGLVQKPKEAKPAKEEKKGKK